MAAELLVTYDTLTKAAEDQHDCGEKTQKIEQMRQDAVIPPGSLGKILPADEILAELDAATAATAENFSDLIESFEGMASRLSAVRDLFIATDEHVAETFDALRQG